MSKGRHNDGFTPLLGGVVMRELSDPINFYQSLIRLDSIVNSWPCCTFPTDISRDPRRRDLALT